MKSMVLKFLGIFSVSLTFGAQIDVPLFHDRFEGENLDQWTGVLGGPHQGALVADPLTSGNHVLTFTGLNAGGDVFTVASLPVDDTNKQYVVKFDYLGLAQSGSVAGN